MMARILSFFLLIIFSGQSWSLVVATSNDNYRYDGNKITENTQNRGYDVIQKLQGDEVRQPPESLSAKPLDGYFFAFAEGFFVTKGPLKNASGNLDDAARAARTQPHNTPNLTEHARAQMNARGVSVDQVVDAANRGSVTLKVGDPVVKRMSTSSGRRIEVRQDVRTNNVVTVIDKGSAK